MVKKELLFTAGQFARIHDVNKRTLQYYDDIGLFRPQVRGENNYRYYSYQQSPELELILTLREMNMSLPEIESYLQHPSPLSLAELVETKTAELEAKIAHLRRMQQLLAEKEQQLRFCISVDIESIELIECGEERLLLSQPIREDASLDKEMAVLMNHIKELGEYSRFNNHSGTVMDIESVKQGEFTEYRFFSLIREDDGSVPVFIKPAGLYLRAFCLGDWSRLPAAYQRILDYAWQQQLQLSGYAYEQEINEMAVSSAEEIITQITIRCDKE